MPFGVAVGYRPVVVVPDLIPRFGELPEALPVTYLVTRHRREAGDAYGVDGLSVGRLSTGAWHHLYGPRTQKL